MGLFDFLKKKQETIELKEQELYPFFEKTINHKFSKLNAKIHETNVEIKYHIKRIKEFLDNLENENFRNPNLPAKEIQTVNGNRENFLKRMRLFVNKIDIPSSYMELDEYCKNFFEDLETLTQETQKSTYVLKEYFGESIKKIAKKTSQTESLFIKLKSLLEKEDMEKVNETRKLFKKHEESVQELGEAKNHKKFIASEINILEQEKQKILKKIHSLEQSNDYRFYKGFLKEKEEILQKELEEKRNLTEQFSQIEKALKKYSKKALNHQIIEKYLKDYADALTSDEKLEIFGILQKLKKQVREGKLELKDKKAEKTQESLNNLTKKYLSEKRKNLLEVFHQKEENKEKIRKNTSILQIREQKSYLETTEHEISEQKNKLKMAENKIESTNPNLILQKIGKNLAELSGENVKWKR